MFSGPGIQTDRKGQFSCQKVFLAELKKARDCNDHGLHRFSDVKEYVCIIMGLLYCAYFQMLMCHGVCYCLVSFGALYNVSCNAHNFRRK